LESEARASSTCSLRGTCRRPVAASQALDYVHPNFFLPVDVLAEVFRGKFYEALKKAFAQGQLGF
jgi:hypothetical protein